MKILQSILEVSGKEAFSFLQGQLTCDMREITEKKQRAALCNLQGRVIASMEVQQESNKGVFLITLSSSMILIVLKALEKYAQFSDVTLQEISTPTPSIDLISSIRQKIAIILPETSELFTPHELNYDQLGFISFNKGCYRGQEIIARMHYRGKLKKQLCYSQVKISESLPENIVNIVKIDDSHYEVLAVIQNFA